MRKVVTVSPDVPPVVRRREDIAVIRKLHEPSIDVGEMRRHGHLGPSSVVSGSLSWAVRHNKPEVQPRTGKRTAFVCASSQGMVAPDLCYCGESVGKSQVVFPDWRFCPGQCR